MQGYWSKRDFAPIPNILPEACVEEVSGDIERQKENTPESDKILLLRQLNALRDPVSRLPFEISSQIFVECLPERRILSPLIIPILFLKVCNAWRDIALAEPRLWAKVEIHYAWSPEWDWATNSDRVVANWLERACSHRLHISLEGPPDPKVLSILWRFSSQLQHLEITPDDTRDTMWGSDDGGFLAGTQPGSLPCLQSLTIYGQGYIGVSLIPLLQLLRLAPNLVELVLHNVCSGWIDAAAQPIKHLVVPNLRCLVFRQRPGFYVFCGILPYISAPRLEKLTLCAHMGSSDIFPFLHRSSPALRELVVEREDRFQQLEQCLALFSTTIIHLEIGEPGPAFLQCLFDKLARDALLNLQHLQLGNVHIHPDSLWNTLLHGLSTRRATMRTLRMTIQPHTKFPPDIRDGFRELAADGMDIWIGSTQNLLQVE
ncbi:hypothetical protein FB45DRAFT_1022264 [Roridomyces roridus]|uniref:F-box domain-containing protein n=1 Tax=Roridomyces roridus TaxID=1738132 RepID=A0AAD7C823_9AGAR|nr:hypothetical protein FB45DRAFT_1022264 [Roridomyces roridus]